MIIDVIDCLLSNAGCCNMKYVMLLKILLYYVLIQIQINYTLMQLIVVDIRRNLPQSADV